MPSRPQKTSPAEIVAEERKQQAFWRNVVTYSVCQFGPILVEEKPFEGVLDIQSTERGLIVRIEGLRRSLKTRLIGAWRVLTG